MNKNSIFALTMLAATWGLTLNVCAGQAANVQDIKQLSDAGIQPQDLKVYLQKNAPDLVKFVGTTPSKLEVQLFTTIAQSKKPVVVKFYINGCGPCKQMGRIVEQVAKELGESILVINIESTEATRNLMRVLNANGVPTLVFFKDGKKVDQFTGTLSAQELTGKLKKLVN
ncbi:MAG: thioredoxin family protein [Candidatus Babeliales bacterium]